MNLEHFGRVATLFNLPTAPPSHVEEGTGVHVIDLTSTPDGSVAGAFTLHVRALGGNEVEVLANWRRAVILEAARVLPTLRNRVAQARAFVLAGDAAIAAIEAELPAP